MNSLALKIKQHFCRHSFSKSQDPLILFGASKGNRFVYECKICGKQIKSLSDNFDWMIIGNDNRNV